MPAGIESNRLEIEGIEIVQTYFLKTFAKMGAASASSTTGTVWISRTSAQTVLIPFPDCVAIPPKSSYARRRLAPMRRHGIPEESRPPGPICLIWAIDVRRI